MISSPRSTLNIAAVNLVDDQHIRFLTILPDGKPFQPIIDGRAATAADYSKMLTTELVFNMPMLFSSNATEHRKLMKKLLLMNYQN